MEHLTRDVSTLRGRRGVVAVVSPRVQIVSHLRRVCGARWSRGAMAVLIPVHSWVNVSFFSTVTATHERVNRQRLTKNRPTGHLLFWLFAVPLRTRPLPREDAPSSSKAISVSRTKLWRRRTSAFPGVGAFLSLVGHRSSRNLPSPFTIYQRSERTCSAHC